MHHKERVRQTDRHAVRQTYLETDIHIDLQTNIKTDRHTETLYVRGCLSEHLSVLPIWFSFYYFVNCFGLVHLRWDSQSSFC